MKLYTRVVRANDLRRTRFHTEQGQFIGVRGLCEFPSLIRRRLAGDAASPWMATGAVQELDRFLTDQSRVLEFGSGSSTTWYARRAAEVVSLEHDQVWARRVTRDLSEAGISNCDLRVLPLESFVDELDRFADSSFDLVVVDNNDTARLTRVECVRAARSKVKVGGALVLDDSDRARYAPAGALLADWSQCIFVGAKPKPLTAIATSVFFKPSAEPFLENDS